MRMRKRLFTILIMFDGIYYSENERESEKEILTIPIMFDGIYYSESESESVERDSYNFNCCLPPSSSLLIPSSPPPFNHQLLTQYFMLIHWYTFSGFIYFNFTNSFLEILRFQQDPKDGLQTQIGEMFGHLIGFFVSFLTP